MLQVYLQRLTNNNDLLRCIGLFISLLMMHLLHAYQSFPSELQTPSCTVTELSSKGMIRFTNTASLHRCLFTRKYPDLPAFTDESITGASETLCIHYDDLFFGKARKTCAKLETLVRADNWAGSTLW